MQVLLCCLMHFLENLVLVVPAPLQQLPLGTVTHLMFNATSPVCPTGPFVFQITSGTMQHYYTIDHVYTIQNITLSFCTIGAKLTKYYNYACSLHSVLPTALEPIFTIDVSTGAVAVDTTGPHLLVQGASGLVTVSISNRLLQCSSLLCR